jgi:HPt (histidine-containing phosphotransfer) domain-containing protein
MSTSIDQVHLERMTLGDRSLEREVLEIFARQTAMTLERIAGAGPARTAAAAHTLKGSARGIGAWRVAQAAERLEPAAPARPTKRRCSRRSPNSKRQASRRAWQSGFAWAKPTKRPRQAVAARATTELSSISASTVWPIKDWRCAA